MRDRWDLFYIGLAQYVSTASKDPSTKTGAVIVGPGTQGVISLGFNGFPSGMPDDLRLYEDRTEKLSRIIHCEMNALLHAHQGLPDGSTLYTYPFMSCDRCVVHMIQAGIRRYVAPVPTKEQMERWGDSFAKTRQYILEVGGELIEIYEH